MPFFVEFQRWNSHGNNKSTFSAQIKIDQAHIFNYNIDIMSRCYIDLHLSGQGGSTFRIWGALPQLAPSFARGRKMLSVENVRISSRMTFANPVSFSLLFALSPFCLQIIPNVSPPNFPPLSLASNEPLNFGSLYTFPIHRVDMFPVPHLLLVSHSFEILFSDAFH